ncbi:hypothetical protein [Tenacibaculum ovolyticum]|uniref:hypothetical protein n=1 Tax=Tenacibaculum ovolyticum TaxID=104270 RepID=UPI003BAA94D4
MITGNKNSFAVEFTQSDSDSKMGYGKVWIQNKFYGSNEDLIYFDGYLISLLDELINTKTIEFEFQMNSDLELFENFENHQNRFEYLIRGATFTDDFTAYGFEKDGKIYLIWKLRTDQESLFTDLKDYGTEVKLSFAKKSEIENIKSKLLKNVSV